MDVASTVGGSSKSADGLLAVAEAVLLLACARRGVDCRPAAESLAGRLERAARLLTDSGKTKKRRQIATLVDFCSIFFQPVFCFVFLLRIAAEDAPLRTGQMYIDALSEVAVHVRPGCLDGALRLIGPELRHYLKVFFFCFISHQSYGCYHWLLSSFDYHSLFLYRYFGPFFVNFFFTLPCGTSFLTW